MSYVSLGQTTMVARTSCITAAEKAKADLDCRIPDVKGLGSALGFTYGTNTRWNGIDACKVAQMPLCPTPTAALFPMRPPPPVMVYTATVAPRMPTPAPAISTISPRVVAAFKPGLQVTPTYVPPEVMEPPPEPEKKMNVAVVGLLALVALGGGYLVYKKMKKPAPVKMAPNRRRQRKNARRRPTLPPASDLCPVCGESVKLTGHTKDGRLIGSCGDAFTQVRWEAAE